MKKDLTQLEILRLPETFNLTDGHAHRKLHATEQAVAEKLSDIFLAVEREQQSVLEGEYLEAFYRLQKQTLDYTKTRYLLLPSASLCLEVIANYVRLARLNVALIEPCFDNLANMFKRHNIQLERFPDSYFETDDFPARLQTIRSKAICIVSPNNPTGITYTAKTFKQLVDFCKAEKRLLVIDASFRSHKDQSIIFDEYKLLQQSGIDYIVVEDSGKTWPTKELKVAVMAMPNQLYTPIYNLYTDFLYHHSPVVVKLVTEMVRLSIADDLQSVKSCITENRRALHEALQGTFLTPCEKPYMSVAWLRIDADITSAELDTILRTNGVFLLPGEKFFWSDHTLGQKYMRVALARDSERFSAAMQRLRPALLALNEKLPRL